MSQELVVTRIRPSKRFSAFDFSALWSHRELLYFLLWRDLKVRYKQTVLGASWAVVQPVFTVVIFTVVFGNFARLPSNGTPYYLNTYCALLPWGLFAGAVNRSGTSLVSSANLISKVYFPRLIIPLSAVLGALVDFAISLGVFAMLLLYHKVVPGPGILLLPLWSLLTLLLGLAVGLWLAAVNVRYRDVSYLLNFMLQIWMYVTPVAYAVQIVPAKWRFLYDLNPMVGLVQGFRWSLLQSQGAAGIPWIPSLVFTVILLAGALFYFRRVERFFADII